MSNCTVEGCDRGAYAKGLCRAHYMRQLRRKRGSPAPDKERPIGAYGQERIQICTRVQQEIAAIIAERAGKEGTYHLAARILTDWAKRHAA